MLRKWGDLKILEELKSPPTTSPWMLQGTQRKADRRVPVPQPAIQGEAILSWLVLAILELGEHCALRCGVFGCYGSSVFKNSVT